MLYVQGDLEKELESQNERRKRTQRMKEYGISASAMNSNTSLHSLTFEKSGCSQRSTPINDHSGSDTDNLEDLKNRWVVTKSFRYLYFVVLSLSLFYSLEISEERVSMLKEKLDHISLEKENDSNLFEQIVANTKNTILQMFVANRNTENTEVMK